MKIDSCRTMTVLPLAALLALAALLGWSPRACHGAHYIITASEPAPDADGSVEKPFGSIALALELAQPGDTVELLPELFREKIVFPRDGAPGRPIVLWGCRCRGTMIEGEGTMIKVDRRHIVLDLIHVGAGYSSEPVIRVTAGADSLILREMDLYQSKGAGVHLEGADGVRIEDCQFHNLLAGSQTGRAVAHGIEALGTRGLEVIGCTAYYCNGYALRLAPGTEGRDWSDATVRDCIFWSGALGADEQGWRKGQVPGLGGIEVVAVPGSRPRLLLEGLTLRGWGELAGSARAAVRLEGAIDCQATQLRCWNNDRGVIVAGTGGELALASSLFHHCDPALAVEGSLEKLTLHNLTFGEAVATVLQGAADSLEARNCLALAPSLPAVLSDSSNLAAEAGWFVSTGEDDYHLAGGAPATDRGVPLPGMELDADGKLRLTDSPLSVGAYEPLGQTVPDFFLLSGVRAVGGSGFATELKYGSRVRTLSLGLAVKFNQRRLRALRVEPVARGERMALEGVDLAAANATGRLELSMQTLGDSLPLLPGAGTLLRLVFRDLSGATRSDTLALEEVAIRGIPGGEQLVPGYDGVVELSGGTARSCDFNADGATDARDVLALLRLARSDPANPWLDWDQDGRWSIHDALALLLDIYRGGCPTAVAAGRLPPPK